MGQALAGPLRIGARVFHETQVTGCLAQPFGIGAVLPVLEKVPSSLRVIVGGVEELLELGVGHGILVHVEGLDLHAVLVEAPRTVLPRILHVDADVVVAFDLSAPHREQIAAAIDADHALRHGMGRSCGRNLDEGLVGLLPFVGEAGQRFGCHLLHLCEGLLDLGIGSAADGEDCAVTVRLRIEREHGLVAVDLGLQLNAVVDIEVAHAGLVGDGHLAPVYVVLVAVDDGPEGLVGERPAAGEDAVHVSRIEGLPVRADEEGREGALDGCHAAGGFAVARGDAVPNAPDVFPALPAFAVEEGVLQIVGLVAVPAVADIDHVARLKPAEAVDLGHEVELEVVAPGHDIPGEGFVAQADLRLEGKRMVGLCRRRARRQAARRPEYRR